MDTATGWTHRFNPSVVQANGRPFQLRAYKRSVRHVTQCHSVPYSADTDCCMCCCCILHSCVQLARVIYTCACVRVRDKLVHNWECKITFSRIGPSVATKTEFTETQLGIKCEITTITNIRCLLRFTYLLHSIFISSTFNMSEIT